MDNESACRKLQATLDYRRIGVSLPHSEWLCPRIPKYPPVQFHGSVFLIVWLGPLFLGWHGAGLLAFRFLVQRAVLKRAADQFAAEDDLMIFQPILEFQYLLYNILIAPAGMLFGGKTWGNNG